MNMAAESEYPLLITYTLFPNVTPTEKTERADIPFTELVDRIKHAPVYIDKAHCPLVSMAEYGDVRTDKECIRHAQNVRRVFGCEFDYDGEQISIEQAAQTLSAAAVRSVLYTSPRYTRDKPRWRALLPFSEPGLPEKRAEYLARANRLLGGIASRESFTLSQSFYIGRVRGAEYVVLETEGRCVDMASELEPLYYHGHKDNGAAPRDETTDAQLRAAFDHGEDRYQAMLKLSARWAARGMSVDDIEASLSGMLGNQSVNGEGIDLRSRCRPLAQSAVDKFGETRAAGSALLEAAAPRKKAAAPLPSIRWRTLEGEPPPRSWLIQDWLGPWPTLTAGSGGAGKTRLWQAIATSLATGKEYLGPSVKPLTVLVWSCEEDQTEAWRTQTAINAYLQIGMADLDRLHLVPRMGAENTLMDLEYGQARFTPIFDLLREQVSDLAADVLVLDNIAQVFGGNVNDAHHTTVFVNAVAGLGLGRPFCPVFLGHVAKGAGSEFAGSMAWENAVRMRWYLGHTLPDQKPVDEDEAADPDVVYLARRKVNYAAKDWRRLRFQNGLLVPDQAIVDPGHFGQSYRNQACQDLVLAALPKLKAMGITPSDSKFSPDYLPGQMIAKRLAAGERKQDLIAAMDRLMSAGRLHRTIVGKYSNRAPRYGVDVV